MNFLKLIAVLVSVALLGHVGHAGQKDEAPASRPDLSKTAESSGRRFPDTAEGRVIKRIVTLRDELLLDPDPSYVYRKFGSLARMAKGFCAKYPDSKYVPEARTTQAMAYTILAKVSKLGVSYLESARELIEPLVARKDLEEPTRVMALFLWSEILYEKHQTQEAIQAFEEIVRLYPKNKRAPQALMSIGAMRVARLEYEKSLAAYRKLAEDYPEDKLAPEAYRQIILIQCDRKKVEEAQGVLAEMLKRFPSSAQSVSSLGTIARTYEENGQRDQAVASYRRLIKLFGDTPAAGSAAGRIRFIGLKGTHIDEVEFKLLDDRVVRPRDFRGKVLMVYFWGAWSREAGDQMPRADWTYRQLKDKGLEALGVFFGFEKKEALQALLTHGNITWPHVFEPRGLASALAIGLGVDRIPMTLLVDRKGVVREVGLTGPELHRAVQKLLEEPAPAVPATQESK